MKKFLAGFLMAFIPLFLYATLVSAAVGDRVRTEMPFEATVLIENLDQPFDMIWGPDNMLWVTERLGKSVIRINPTTGEQKVALRVEDAHAAGGHEGVLGLAVTPNLIDGGGGTHVYLCYTFLKDVDGTSLRRKRVVRYEYDGSKETLVNPVTVLDNIPAGDDHNGGRIVLGPDRKLYLSLGELGHNQGANMTKKNEAQRLPTAAEVNVGIRDAYVGKILRFNPDGSIPQDNPTLGGVRSHVYSYGHRNPQGLHFVGDKLFSCEHGPSVDDEINLIAAGGNYGWPHVAGYRDDQAYHFADWFTATPDAVKAYDGNDPDVFPQSGVKVENETDWRADNFVQPLKTFHTVPNGYNFKDPRFKGFEYLYWPTVAPSCIVYYPEDGPIVPWRNSLLMTTLKTGALYQLPLNTDKESLQGREALYFKTGNRYRAVCLNPAADTIYILTDKSGNVMDDNWLPTDKMQNPGAVIAIKYTGTK